MDRKGTNELISGEKSFIAILSNLRVYFVVRLPDYTGRTLHKYHARVCGFRSGVTLPELLKMLSYCCLELF